MIKKKKVAIFFTSGLDSTYLVYKNLIEGNTVLLYYVDLGNNVHKSWVEQHHINQLYEMFRTAFPNQISKSRQIVTMTVNISEYNYPLIQMPIWVFAASMIQSCGADEIQIAYVMNDCAISYLKEFQKVYRAYSSFADGKPIKLTFPLIKESKDRIIDKLPSQYAAHVWACENPDYEGIDPNAANIESFVPCGRCVPCKTYKRIFEDSYGNSKYPYLTKKTKPLYDIGGKSLMDEDLIDDGPIKYVSPGIKTKEIDNSKSKSFSKKINNESRNNRVKKLQ